MRTHEKEYDSRRTKIHVDLVAPLGTSWNQSVMPFQNSTISLVHNQLAADVVHKLLVFVGVGKEKL
jgi:hypothetical protein